MHLDTLHIDAGLFPGPDRYPFNLAILRSSPTLRFTSPVTFFSGENGSGKSTVLRAAAIRCGIHIWREVERTRYRPNPLEDQLYRAVTVDWSDGPVPGSFFSSQSFGSYARLIDEWAASDPEVLNHYGGRSLMTLSHGQCLMAYFRSRYGRRGLYFLDEPETALSPRTQMSLLRLLEELGARGHAQFIIATHSPILLSCREAVIQSFDGGAINPVAYGDTDHVRVYREFMAERLGP